jgi:dipeptidyl aminopeptidase/acylaminoacyl peptidase
VRLWSFVLLLGCAPMTLAIAACGDETPKPIAPIASAKPTEDASVTPATAAPPPHADATLPPRAVFFGNPDRTRVRISPDGTKLAFLANEGGVLNVFVGPFDDPSKAKAITHVTKRHLREYHWSMDGKSILYFQDKDGDENWRLHGVDVASSQDRELAGVDGVQVVVIDQSPRRPSEIVIGINDRDKRYHDLYVLDTKSGKRALLQKNDGFERFVVDDDFKVRFALLPRTDGGLDVQERGAKDAWTTTMTIPMEDHVTTDLVDFDKAGTTLYMLDSRGRNTAALVTLDLKTKKSKLVMEDAAADIEFLLIHPTKKTVQAAEAEYDRTRWHVIDSAIQPDFDYLRTVSDGEIGIASRSLDDKRWIVAYATEGATRYYRYDRAATPHKAELLFLSHDALSKVVLSKMLPVVIKSRDGLDLVSYLTLPPAADPQGTGTPKAPLPMVVFVHGGPWARDSFGLNPMTQWLASRGYAVLQVNYRGSTGFGKAFINAANHEWAGKMHDDIIDAVKWAVDKNVADAAHVAILGGSYGGYETLVGLTFSPDVFACGVDIVGPSNLTTLLASIPAYWASAFDDMTKRIGDPRTEDGKKLLAERSPLFRVDAIKKPLLIGQGKNDPRVKQAEADQIVDAMQKKSIPVTYVLYPDEGHGFNRVQNKTSFNAITEIFLAQCLGGSYQPIGADFTGSSLTVPVGKAHITSLSEALH